MQHAKHVQQDFIARETEAKALANAQHVCPQNVHMSGVGEDVQQPILLIF